MSVSTGEPTGPTPGGLRLRLPAAHPILWLLAAFVLLGAVYAVVTPLFEISDELWHYPMVKTLADGNWLPVQDPAQVQAWRQEGSQPPLYYLLMAAATFWIDTDDLAQVRWINPHTDNGLITADRNNNIAIHRPGEASRWTGAALAVRLIRLLSVLLSAGTVYFTYRLALEIRPDQSVLALIAAAITAFTPMFVFISASVNNDTLAVALSAATLWLLARWIRRPPERLGREHLVLGLLLGAGALSKQSALGLWGLAGLVLVYLIWRRAVKRETRQVSRITYHAVRPTLLQCFVVFGLAALIAFPWYLRNFQLYGDWLGWNTFVSIVGARPQPAGLWQLWGERVGFVQAYWGLFGGVSVPLPDWAYTLLNLAAGLALVGLVWGGIDALRRRLRPTRAERGGTGAQAEWTTVAQWGLLIGWILLLFVGLVRWTSITWASQGRLIFPAISAISLLIVAGLAHIGQHLPVPRLATLLPGSLAAFMAGLSAAVPFTVIVPHYTPPRELSPAELAAIPQRLDVDFGGELQLLGYHLRTTAAAPGGSVRLTLFWQSQIAMDRNWSVFVHLVDQDDILVAQRDRYPGQGLLATTLLQPGQTWADDYVIALPAGAFSPATLRVRVGVYDLSDGVRLPAGAAGEWAEFGQVALAGRELATRLGPVPNALRQSFGGQIELAGYTLDRRVLRPGETLTVTLYWRALSPIPANYSVSARVRGERSEDQTRWAAQDSWPQAGQAPTSAWRVGELLADPYALTLAAATPPGQYFVEIVIYDSQTLRPLPLWTDDGRPTDAGSLLLTRVRVTP